MQLADVVMKVTSRLLLCAMAVAGFIAGPAYGRTVSRSVGPRGGSVTHYQGAYRSGTVTRGPYGRSAAHYQGPYRSGTAVRGPYGGTAAYGRGPYGHAAVYGRAPYRGPYGRSAYTWGGVRYYRPGWNVARVNTFNRAFVGYPGFRSYGMYYGLVPPLAAFSSLAFLSAGLLTASYIANNRTVYVYVVDQGGQNIEYRVDQDGNILSQQPVY
jgi:hypothetical protein